MGKVLKRMRRVPHNGYLEIWLQRVTQPKTVGIEFSSDEKICQIVNRETPELWKNSWIASRDLKAALDVSKICIGSVEDAEELVSQEEVQLFYRNSQEY